MNKKLNNKGFSLVELIIVIAIMAVLVGVLAPQFIKYVEQSRRSTDISNAEEIRSAILADIADGKITGSSDTAIEFVSYVSGTTYPTTGTATIAASTIATAPKIQGNLTISAAPIKGKAYYVTFDATKGECSVYTDSERTYCLTTAGNAGDKATTKFADDYKIA